MTICPTKLFQFLRGALRGAYGIEDLTRRNFLIIGISAEGQDLLAKLCIPDTHLRFYDQSLCEYRRAFGVCGAVEFYDGQFSDVVVDFVQRVITIKGKSFSLDSISDNAYEQGIHTFYL